MEAIKIFGKELGFYLINNFENPNQTIEKLKSKLPEDYLLKDGDEPLRACSCAASSECYRITGVSIGLTSVGLSWEYGNCSGKCYVQTYFFGLWESSNSGRCYY